MRKGKQAMMNRITELAKHNNLQVLGIERGKHYRVEVQRPDGSTGKLTMSASPSCYRGEKNVDTQWRHFAMGISDLKFKSQKD